MTHNIESIVADTIRRTLATHNASPWRDSEGAAAYIGCTAGTMKTWRSRGEGPNYHIIQQKLVRYHVNDLDAFVRGEVAR